MPKPTAQQCHALITYYVTRYKDEIGHAPVLNRNKARFGFEGILMDHSADEARELIDYYLNHYDNPSVEWLIYNYEKIDQAIADAREAKKIQEARRAQTAKRLEEWRARWQK